MNNRQSYYRTNGGLIAIIFVVNYFLAGLFSFYIINSKRYETFKTVWVFIVFLIPFLGQILFLSLGVSGIQRRSLSNYRKDLESYLKYENYDLTNNLLNSNSKWSSKWKPPLQYLATACNRPIYDQNQITLIKSSAENIKQLERLILKAKSFIHIEYYYIDDGLVADYLFELLKIKAQAKVEVRIIVDYLGGFKKISKRRLSDLKASGIQIRFFNPPFKQQAPISLLNFRCHKKIFLVDNKYAIYGSANISDHYYGISRWHFSLIDYNYLVEGSIVNSFNLLFAFDWHHHTKNNDDVDQLLANPNKYFQLHNLVTNQPTMCQLTEHGPDLYDKVIINNLLQLITNAKSEILIATPYFHPDRPLINALKNAALSGIVVTLLLPHSPDPAWIVLTMNRMFYKELLEAGIRIYEYYGYNHEKVMIVDHEMVYTGTYNWDFRSLYMNYETAMQIISKPLAKAIIHEFNERIQASQLITLKKIGQLWTWKAKLIGFLITIFHPLI